MIILYVLGAILLVFIVYVLFLFVCSLFVNSKKNTKITAVFTEHS